MRKQITSLLLTLAMLLSLVPTLGVTASAAETWVTVNSFEDLKTAVEGKKEYIKLGEDIDTASYNEGIGLLKRDELTFDDVYYSCTLDLNGKTLALVSNDTNISQGIYIGGYSHLTIQDTSSAQTGKISGAFSNVFGGYKAKLIRVNSGRLTLEGGTFTVTSHPYKDNAIVIDSFESFITIKDGVKIIQPEFNELGSRSNLDGSGYTLKAESSSSRGDYVIIEGGEFDGCVNLTASQSENGSIQINGGTFKKDVQVLYKADENNPNPAVTVNGGIFEGNVYLQRWPWKVDLYVPYRLNGGTFKGNLNLQADYTIDADYKPEGNPNFVRGFDKCFGYSAVVTPHGTFTGPDAYTGVLKKTESGERYKMSLDGTADNPVRIIPNAWGMMESVTLDGNKIDYAKDWDGTPVVIKNNEDHTITFKWKDLADELKTAGYRYDAYCMRYTSGDTTGLIPTDQIPTGTEYRFTIPKGKDPAVYSFDLRLDLKKGSRPVNTFANQHIVRLVVVEAPEVQTLTGKVNYTNGAVFGKPILFSGTITPGVYMWECQFQWQRSTDGGSTWKDIPDATEGSYTPGAADMGENVRIRIVITKKGYLGEIVGAPVKVSKAANNNYPAAIQLEAVKDSAGNYTGFKITNFNSDCEYVYSTTSTPNWSANQISSATVTGLTSDTTYYVFARFKETKTHTAGSIVSKNSIRLYDYVPLQYVLLEGYDSGNTIYIKQGESVTLKVSADPSNTNSWNEITFKDSSNTTPSHITISNEKIAASTGTATPFPNNHTITITGVSKGSATLDASYPGYAQPYYGRWNVVVYDDSTVANALRLENVYAYEDITLSVNDEAELPTELPKLLPENSGYHLEWRIVKVGAYGASYKTSDDNITLENGKIKLTKAHTGSEKTRLDLVAVKDNSDTYKTLPKTSLFYVTVSETPLVELTGLTLTPKKVDLEVGKTYQLSAVKEPANAEGSLTWTSSKPAVAAVDKSGKVTAKGEGTATITVTCGTKSAACTVTVSKPLVPEVPGTSFTDVPAGAYYEEAVGWAVEKGITKGTSDSTFTPDGVCTRAQAVTFLWRAAGSPAAKAGSLPFADVKAGSYYDDAVRWAVENGVTVGTSATTFSPNATCSRAQIVTFLWRAQKSPAAGSANPFDDVANNAYYADAVQWAVQKDITKGTGATSFSPDANCIRAQIVTFLYRSMK